MARYGYRGSVVFVGSDMTKIDNSILESLECGDFVIKCTGKQKHRYFVSYKEQHVGICITYLDASCVETVSYDFTDGKWVYNSTDVAHIGE